MSDGSAAFAEYETEDAAPAARPVHTPVVDTTAAPVASPDTLAANEESFGKEALGDETVSYDLYNDGGSDNLTGDQKATKNIREWGTPSEWNIGGNGGGPLNQQTAADRAQKRDEEALDRLIEMVEEAYEKKKQQEEHARKWDEALHDVGGHKIAGHKLMAMRNWMEDPQHQDDFESDLMNKEGLSREEAKKRRQKVQEFLDLKAKERDPQGLNPQEKKRLETLTADPHVGDDLVKYVEPRMQAGIGYEKSNLGLKNEEDYAAGRNEALSYSAAEQKLADKAASKEPAYKKPDPVQFSASENLISSERLTSNYNMVAVGKPPATQNEQKVQVATAPKPASLESTVQVSGTGFG